LDRNDTGFDAVFRIEKYTAMVYFVDVLKFVVLSRRAQKDLATVPNHVAVKLQDWVEDVEDRGL
jgi:hypothetical protein